MGGGEQSFLETLGCIAKVCELSRRLPGSQVLNSISDPRLKPTGTLSDDGFNGQASACHGAARGFNWPGSSVEVLAHVHHFAAGCRYALPSPHMTCPLVA